jgi:hypothetical protein
MTTHSNFSSEYPVALEGDLAHNAAANDVALEGLHANAGMGEAIDASFTGHSGGNAADNDAEVDGSLGEQADDFFGGKDRGGNAAANDAEVDDQGEQADDFFASDNGKRGARARSDASQPRNYLAGMGYRAPNNGY